MPKFTYVIAVFDFLIGLVCGLLYFAWGILEVWAGFEPDGYLDHFIEGGGKIFKGIALLALFWSSLQIFRRKVSGSKLLPLAAVALIGVIAVFDLVISGFIINPVQETSYFISYFMVIGILAGQIGYFKSFVLRKSGTH